MSKIKGYRTLSDLELSMIDKIKTISEDVGIVLNDIRNVEGSDQRWVQIAQDDLQKGFMALTRSIAKPTTF